MEKKNKKRDKVFSSTIVLAALIVIGFIFARQYWANNGEENVVKNVEISNRRVIMERMVKQQTFYQHVIALMQKDKDLTNQERAQLLADSIPATESEEMAANWGKAGFTASDKPILYSILSENSQKTPSNSGQPFDPFISEEGYALIFDQWKKLQPDNAFLKILFKPEKTEAKENQ